MKLFDLNSCRSKLEDHYQQTATVPTSVWSKKSVVDIHQIYTRLSWVKEEQTPTGTTQSELKHYTELFTANKNGVTPKRILVQGQTGIGKSTFVKKLLVDWVGVNKGTGDEQAAVLKNFELVVAVNLKEVSKYQSLRDVITLSNVFAKEDKYMTEGLVDYISNNQEKVLLIFDGYDEYRCGRDSEIYEIFSGNSLRSCSVLLTTRISKADELLGGEDLHAEITGFSKVDRKRFMRRFFKSDKEVWMLEHHLYQRQLNELAKVPLLLLFFCILWRKGQSKSFPKSKTKLYVDIIQFILNHSHSKQTGDKTKKAPQYVELKSFKDILSEVGKVALQGLLKDDHLFEYSQLSDSVRCDESVFIGLLQITEYSETSQPVGMVSFIHKSIQEFLAAWYVTYRCIPEGGNLGEIGLKLEECMALENVFEFICDLSEEGAFATFRHLKSVRISDPSLDLSQTVPAVESATDVRLSDVTDCHWQFIVLVLDLFERVESNADLSRPCLDCLGNVLLLCSERSLPKDVLLKKKEAKPLCLVSGITTGYFVDSPDSVLTLNRVAKMLVTEIAEIFKVAEFFEKFNKIRCYCRCSFSSVLDFFDGQVYFNITHLKLLCKDHAALFTDYIVPSHSSHLSSGQLSLKFLKVLDCSGTSFLMESLGAVAKHCNHLESTEVSGGNDSLIHFLQHVPNYRRCSLSILFCCLSSKGAVELSYLLPRFENIIQLDLRLAECSDEAVTKLVAAIKHKTLENLTLNEANMTSAAAEALSQSLPEFSTLRTLKISSLAKCSDVAVTKLVAAIKHKTLEELQLSKMNLPLATAKAFGKSLPTLLALQTLEVSGLTDCCNEAVTKLVAAIKHKTLEKLQLSEINLTSAVAEVLRQLLSELSALQSLSIVGLDGCSLQFQSFDALIISGWKECPAEAVTRLIDVMKHKPLEKLELSKIPLTSAAAEALSQLLPKLSALKALKICGLAKCSSRAVTSLVAAIKHKTLNKLTLSEINPTAAVADALRQSLWELSALRTLKYSVLMECPAEAVTCLAAAFKHKTLKELELSGILTLEAAEAIGQSLWKLSALRTLKISVSTECSAETVTSLAAAFNETLNVLKLGGIKLTLEVGEALGQSLGELSALQTLKISVSPECSAEAVTGLAAAFKHKPLKELELSGIKLTLEAAEAIGQSLLEVSDLRLELSGFAECSAKEASRLLEIAIPRRKFMLAVVPHVGYSEFKVKNSPLRLR